MVKKPAKRGPKPQRFKIAGGFQTAARAFLAAKKPPGGWPPPPRVYAKRETASVEEE